MIPLSVYRPMFRSRFARVPARPNPVLPHGLRHAAPRRPIAVLARVWSACAVLSLVLSAPAQAQRLPAPGLQAVGLELVLAIDSSSSVSLDEFFLQMSGFAQAFRDADVIDAIESTGGIAVAVVQWGGDTQQEISIGWSHIAGAADAERLADLLDTAPRLIHRAGTGIAAAVTFSLALLEENPFQAPRQVIDVSGDGKSNQGAAPEAARALAETRGVTVNGLAILNEEPHLDVYFRDRVIGGPNAFVISANDYENYATAIREKLLREIISVPVAANPARRTLQAADHGAGDATATEPRPRQPEDSTRSILRK